MKEIDIKKTFGTDLGIKTMSVPDANDSAYIPDVDSAYVFDRERLKSVLHYLQRSYGDALFLQGPAGVGKTTLINQVAARLQWPVDEVTLCNRSVITDLVGTPVVFENSMQYVYGPLTMAMLYGHILILNEIDTVSAGDLTFLNDIIEGRMLTAPDNPSLKVRPHPLFRIVFTANTRGDGDDCGFYTGTRLFNQAFVDRMRFIAFDYNSHESERQILKLHCPCLSDNVITLLLKFVKEVRFNTIGTSQGVEQLTSPLTTRALVKIGRYISDFENVSVQEAVLKFYALRFSEVECTYIMRLCSDVFGNNPFYASSETVPEDKRSDEIQNDDIKKAEVKKITRKRVKRTEEKKSA